MKKLNSLFINGSLHFAIKYLGYVVWQVFALMVKTVIYLLLFGYVLALIVIVLITACAPLCSLSMCFGTEVWEATLVILDLYGLFLVLLAATAGMQHILDYVMMSPEGTLLHPIPPVKTSRCSTRRCWFVPPFDPTICFCVRLFHNGR